MREKRLFRAVRKPERKGNDMKITKRLMLGVCAALGWPERVVGREQQVRPGCDCGWRFGGVLGNQGSYDVQVNINMASRNQGDADFS